MQIKGGRQNSRSVESFWEKDNYSASPVQYQTGSNLKSQNRKWKRKNSQEKNYTEEKIKFQNSK